MNSDIEEQIFSINTKVGRLVDIENKIEKLLNEKSEVSQMSPKDREVILNEIKAFQTDFSEGLKGVFLNNQAEFKKDKIALLQQGQQSVNDSLLKLQNLLIDFQGTADACKELKEICQTAVKDAINMASVKMDLEHVIETTVKDSLKKQTQSNEQAAIKLGNTAVEMRKLYRRTVHDAFAISAMILTMIAFLGGIMIHQILMNKTCEDVFKKFYSEKYEKEIAEPLKTAQKEAAVYLKQQQKEADKYLSDTKKQADEDLKNKKAEAKKYLDDQMAEARIKAQEEYDKRMELYSQQVQAAVDKKIKKEKSKPMEGN